MEFEGEDTAGKEGLVQGAKGIIPLSLNARIKSQCALLERHMTPGVSKPPKSMSNPLDRLISCGTAPAAAKSRKSSPTPF
jgi:hypothetical protein